jgi:hypothetical protein
MFRFSSVGLLMVLVAMSVFASGCIDQMSPTQKGAGGGALVGALGGALLGKSEDRNKNALIGAGVGALAGGMYGQHKTTQQLRQENAQLRRHIETQQVRDELERLRAENARLRGEPEKTPAQVETFEQQRRSQATGSGRYNRGQGKIEPYSDWNL